ncbi:potassium channel family protein [Novosphingobium sp.]|uniref:potassium channel family protein n=1 Tax=Novosphingobium sp. TaxID=1874826 RepID=UPI0025FC5340|nr:potassium channel family protein [Novosphingobium sp.]
MSQFGLQIIASVVMALISVMIHGAGLLSLSRMLRSESTVEHLKHIDPMSLRGGFFTLCVVLAMFMLHGLEILAFALFFMAIYAIPNFEDAFYYSTISYSTVGYHDMHMAANWRLLGAFESLLGIFLLGWSTAFFFRMLDRIESH